MKIPKYIKDILGNPFYFDLLYLEKLKAGATSEDAYNEALKEVKKYVPKYKPINSHSTEQRKFYISKSEMVDVPDDVIAAVLGDFDKVFHEFYKRNNHRKEAYDKATKLVQQYYPRWKPASSYESWKSTQSINHSKKLKAQQNRKKPKT